MAKRATKKAAAPKETGTSGTGESPAALMSKTDAAKTLLGEGITSPKLVAAEAAKRWNIEVPSSLVSNLKSKLGKGGAKGKRGRPKGKRGPSAASTTPSRNVAGNIGAVVKACESLVGATGGVEQAKKALDAYSALAAL